MEVRPRLIWALLAVGLLFRVAVSFPAHKYPADADTAMNALCAFKVLRGEAPVFVVALRAGSLSCHMTAVLFYFFGVSRTTLALGPTISVCLLLPIWYLFLREVLGPQTALVGLLFIAIPSPAYTFWTYMPNTYPETLLLCGATLWLASRLAGGDRYWLTSFGLGVSAGIGWWNSIQTLQCSGPALAFLLWRRPRLFLDRSFVAPATLGFLIGAAPWLAFNLYYPLASFRGNVATQASGLEGLIENGHHLLTKILPGLIAASPLFSGRGLLSDYLALPTLLVITASALFFFLLPVLRRRRKPQDSDLDPGWDPWLLFLLVTFAVIGLFVVSGAGSPVWGSTERYVLPLYLIVPGLLAVFLRHVALWSRLLAGALAGVVLLFNLVGTYLPWDHMRQRWVRNAEQDAGLLAFLAEENIDAVLGNFWHIYPLNFLSQEEIRAIPLEPNFDLDQVAAGLPASPQRWAIVAKKPVDLESCIERTRLEGTLFGVSSAFHVFLPRDNPPPDESPRDFLDRIRPLCDLRRSRAP